MPLWAWIIIGIVGGGFASYLLFFAIVTFFVAKSFNTVNKGLDNDFFKDFR